MAVDVVANVLMCRYLLRMYKRELKNQPTSQSTNEPKNKQTKPGILSGSCFGVNTNETTAYRCVIQFSGSSTHSQCLSRGGHQAVFEVTHLPMPLSTQGNRTGSAQTLAAWSDQSSHFSEKRGSMPCIPPNLRGPSCHLFTSFLSLLSNVLGMFWSFFFNYT